METVTTTTAPAPSAQPESAPGANQPNQHNAPVDKVGTELGNSQKPAGPPELFEVKINGQVKKYTLDQLKAKASMGDAASERFEKAAEIAKKAQAREESMKKDFMKALLDPELGLSKDQIRDRFEKWYHDEFIAPETMTPEQRRLQELEEYKKEQDDLKAKAEEEAKTSQERMLEAKIIQDVQKDIITALEQSNLPKTKFMAARMAAYMKQNLSKGYDAPMEVIVEQVRNEWQSIFRAPVEDDSVTPEMIVEMLGDKVVNKIRQYDLGRLKSRFGGKDPKVESTGAPSFNRKAGQGRPMSEVDKYFNELRRSK